MQASPQAGSGGLSGVQGQGSSTAGPGAGLQHCRSRGRAPALQSKHSMEAWQKCLAPAPAVNLGVQHAGGGGSTPVVVGVRWWAPGVIAQHAGGGCCFTEPLLSERRKTCDSPVR